MNPQAYRAFTQQLLVNLKQDSVNQKADSRVIGLVAMGSMANRSHEPDEWSDHDFWVVTREGEQEYFRQHFDWLPDSADIVYWNRETEHGLKVIYRSGHLLEYAVFSQAELSQVTANGDAYHVLYESAPGQIENALQKIVVTALSYQDDRYYLGQLLGNIQVGVSRHARGEYLSARVFVTHYALVNVLLLMSKHLDAPPNNKHRLDNLDPLRRVEQVYPDMAAEIRAALLLDIPQVAQRLLDITRQHFGDTIADFPFAAFDAIQGYIAKAE